MDGLKAKIRGGLESRRVCFFFVTEEQTNELPFTDLQHKERDFRFISDYIFLLVRSKCCHLVDIPHTRKGTEYLCPTIGDQNKSLSNQKEPRWMFGVPSSSIHSLKMYS